MNLLISVDMEGISGMVLNNHVLVGQGVYERFRKLMPGVYKAVRAMLALSTIEPLTT